MFHCCLASYQYLALVLVFLNLVLFCNRHFWRCMLLHTKCRIELIHQTKLSCYVCNRCLISLYIIYCPKICTDSNSSFLASLQWESITLTVFKCEIERWISLGIKTKQTVKCTIGFKYPTYGAQTFSGLAEDAQFQLHNN